MAEGTFGLSVQQVRNFTERGIQRALAKHLSYYFRWTPAS
jgi:hypothetical protein